MDWMLIVTAVASAAALASAAVAISQAVGARRSGRDAVTAKDEAFDARDESALLAAKATDAFIRQAAAQEKANELKEREMTPAPWVMHQKSASLFQVVNNSGRSIEVEDFSVEPDEAAGRVRVQVVDQSGHYEYGDAFDFILSQAMGLQARKLIIRWRFSDEPDTEANRFIIAL